ncbi:MULTISPECIES: LxmA leader domain family RiPP [Streptomyces]|uniref:LxmA leader domain family RiPP n=1 Tax=Streptomyces TaxID=1883 RepID=UPI0024420B96|nr:LxmA leader domain family RiPP [Streptomyces sp. DH10]MDG9714531.1 LxmA leader domain family RiPP [Streptomyces sp. DH10]
MDKSVAIMELVSNYDAYTDVEELNISAAADAPATTPVCAIGASSGVCASAVSAAGALTYHKGC